LPIFILVLRLILDQWLLSYVILQLIGVPDRAEKDEIVKAVMGLKNAEIDEGYTIDVVTARQVWTSYTLWLVDYKVFLNLAFEVQADKVSGVVVGCCSYLILLYRIFWWMLGISFFLSQNMLVTWGKKSPLNLPFKFVGLGCQVLFAFFKRYTWRFFIPWYFSLVQIFLSFAEIFWLLLFYSFCSGWRIKACAGDWTDKSSASKCQAIYWWLDSFYGTSWGKKCEQLGWKITPWIYSSLVIYPFLTIGAFLKCAVAKIGFEKKKVSQGFEALARAQCLLRSKPSLAKMTLLSQVRNFL